MSFRFKSLYVHFPFCETKCHYCDFYSIGRENTQATDRDRFVKSLKAEVDLYHQAGAFQAPFETVFFGGGTPSMTPVEDMRFAFGELLAPSIQNGTEWTMEANPSFISPGSATEKLKQYRSFGVNRLSFGIQSTQDHLLKVLGRVHNRENAFQTLHSAFEAGFENVSTDLICGVPGQTLKDIEESLTLLTHFPITHLSCYLLTLPKSHPLSKQMPEEDEQLRHLLLVHDFLASRGFEQYEISNFAKPGREARHNLNYWKGVPYLGLGPSAHSFDKKKRFKNLGSLHRYAEATSNGRFPIETEEDLSPSQTRLERWMLALRLSEGFPKSWIDQEVPHKWPLVEKLIQEDLIRPHPFKADHLRLTTKGFFLSDQIVSSIALLPDENLP